MCWPSTANARPPTARDEAGVDAGAVEVRPPDARLRRSSRCARCRRPARGRCSGRLDELLDVAGAVEVHPADPIDGRLVREVEMAVVGDHPIGGVVGQWKKAPLDAGSVEVGSGDVSEVGPVEVLPVGRHPDSVLEPQAGDERLVGVRGVAVQRAAGDVGDLGVVPVDVRGRGLGARRGREHRKRGQGRHDRQTRSVCVAHLRLRDRLRAGERRLVAPALTGSKTLSEGSATRSAGSMWGCPVWVSARAL